MEALTPESLDVHNSITSSGAASGMFPIQMLNTGMVLDWI
jgi:hypothetical protein